MFTVQGLTKVYANRFDTMAGGVRDASFALPEGTFFTLLGPSGCGKTTMLRSVAGLERPDAGRVAIDDRVLFDAAQGVAVPMNLRGIGMVFQSYAIWPHMTVFENIAFPLRVSHQRRFPREEIRRLVEEALATVGLAGYGDRPAPQLSGGQQQRVALARAIVHRPKLLLLDEPLSNLDAALREEMRAELRRLQQQIGVTTIYVTHDQAEALALSDLVAVMEKGRIVQVDAPRTVYCRPANRFVANFIGAANLLEGISPEAVYAGAIGPVALEDGPVVQALFPGGSIAGAAATVSLRPESITLRPAAAVANDSALRGVVATASFLGSSVRYDVLVGRQRLRVEAPAEPAYAQGTEVELDFAPAAAVALT